MQNNFTIADMLMHGLAEKCKGWKSAKQQHDELMSDLEKLKKNLADIKKFTRTAKDKYSARQIDLLELETAVAKLQLHVDSLEESED
jgi:predicted  nucleic acid-binding Zn-ribbon protein